MEKKWWSKAMDWLAVLIFIVIMLTCWINKSMQDVFLWYANLIFFVSLALLFFSQVNWWERLQNRDYELYLVVSGCILAVVNLVLAHSHMGAIFTIADFLLMLYLADKVKFSRNMVLSLTVICAAVVLYWVFYKRASYGNVDFNSNGASRIVYTAAVFWLYGMRWLLGDHDKIGERSWSGLFVLAMAVILWQAVRLDARGTVLGVIAAVGMYFCFPKKRWSVYLILACSLLFPLGYLLISKLGVMTAVRFAGKKVMSGRDVIWSAFGELYIQHPIIGVGSDFERLVPQLHYKEVHHALLDLLFVHGGSMFLFALYFFVKRLRGLFETGDDVKWWTRSAMAISILYGMIIMGTFENYYIVAPCSTVFFLILVLEHQKRTEKENGVEER